MKTRTLIILLIILGFLAGVGALIIRLKATDRSKEDLGVLLLGNLPANEIVSITIQGAKDSVSLAKEEDRWIVVDRFHYPADFSQIIDLVRKLKDVKIGRQFESSEETQRRLSLKDPDDPDASEKEKGIRILLGDKKKTPLASLLLGKTREGGDERRFPSGQYVRLGKESKIYLIDQHFAYLQKKPAGWLDKTLVEVKEEEVKKISCMSPEAKKIHFAFERPRKEQDLEPVNLPKDRKVKKSALERLSRALSSLRIEDVAGPSDDSESVGMERSKRLEYHLFKGMTYHLYFGKACSETDPCLLQLEVDYEKPAPEKEETGECEPPKKEEDSSEKTPEELALEAKQLNARLSRWVYVIPKWQHDAFLTDLDQLLEKSEK
ncbi:MAG TPA: DUF4340 domain-containing protein [Desulfobacterales bacterium]|nr:DUF4340 domain-containing protein [Desulfobacterales bacterium]